MHTWFGIGTTRVNFRLPDDLLAKADDAAEVTHKNRTELIVEALREYLREVEDEAAFKKGSSNSTLTVRSGSTR